MELKKPNQISIKLNGSAVQPKKEKSIPTESRKPFIPVPAPAVDLPLESSEEIFPIHQQSNDESLNSVEISVESTTEEDAMFRLNQLRSQTTVKQTIHEQPDEAAHRTTAVGS